MPVVPLTNVENIQLSVQVTDVINRTGNITLSQTAIQAGQGLLRTDFYKNGILETNLGIGVGSVLLLDGWAEADYWQVRTVADDLSEDASDLLAYPYYPVYKPESQFYQDARHIHNLGTAQDLRTVNDMLYVLFKIRNEFEFEKARPRGLQDMSTTVVGPLHANHLVEPYLPVIHIQAERTNIRVHDNADDEHTHTVRCSVYVDGPDSSDNMYKAVKILDDMSQTLQYIFELGGVANTYDTGRHEIIWPQPTEAIAANNVYLIHGMLRFDVRTRRIREPAS